MLLSKAKISNTEVQSKMDYSRVKDQWFHKMVEKNMKEILNLDSHMGMGHWPCRMEKKNQEIGLKEI